MRCSRGVVTAAVAASALWGSNLAAAHAGTLSDAPSTALYVDGASASCTDTGGGTSDAPFCTIQAAANAATAGDIVDISKGVYLGAVDITNSGTAAAPIVFQAVGGQVSLADATGQSGPVLSLDGASYVTFKGSEGVGALLSQRLVVTGVQVTGSAHITFDSTELAGVGIPGVHLAGSSSDVTVSRSRFIGNGGGVLIDAGSSGDVVTTNWFQQSSYGISAVGAIGTAIASNTMMLPVNTGDAISLTAGSTGTTVENNVISYPSGALTSTVPIAVDSTSTSGTTVDYNVVSPPHGTTQQGAYSWAGTSFETASALYQATGQGLHDSNASPALDSDGSSRLANAPQVNSANASAPGMLSTDVFGDPCSANPVFAATGTGTPDYCARGDFQGNYSVTTLAGGQATTAKSITLGLGVNEALNDDGISQRLTLPPTPAVSYTIDWGDGSVAQTVQGSSTTTGTAVPHTYARLGTYAVTATARLTGGTTAVTTTTVTTAGSGYTPLGPKRILDTRKGIGAPEAKVSAANRLDLKVADVDGIPANATAVAVDLTAADSTAAGYVTVGVIGTSAGTSNLNYAKGQTVADFAIVPVNPDGGIQIYAGGGATDVIADVSGYFVQNSGNGYTPLTAKRILDTRKGTGAPKAKVAANKGLPVAIVGADTIPAGVTAVAVHVTVTNPIGGGWIGAEPDGAGTPGTSILNYAAGQTVADTVIVPVAADGKIELYNGGASGPVDLIADVDGYFSAGSSQEYVPITAFRAFNSRDEGLLYPDGVLAGVPLAENWYNSSAPAFPSGATMVATFTMTQEQEGGYITAYPDGSANPGTSNVNFTAGQTVANLAVVPSAGNSQAIDIDNVSPGFDEVIVDVLGYFANS